MKKALITGITGQDGSYLAELLLNKGYEVHGVVRRASTFNTKRIDHLYSSPLMGTQFFTHYGDVTDALNISQLVADIKPDELYNLAAQSHVKTSFEIPGYTAQVDALGTLNILEAVKNHSPNTKLYQASTSELYGGMGFNMPATGYTETSAFYPRSPYGCAKLYGFWATKNYREAYNLFACNGILFNHESPRRGETFVTRKITMWFAEYIKSLCYKQKIKPLQIGNINAFRDWSHAEDCVMAQWLILQQDKPEDYVISSGESHSVKEFIELCFKLQNKSLEWYGQNDNEYAVCNGDVVVQVNPKYYRPTEVNYLLGDSTKARTVLGWKPKHSFMDLVKDMVIGDFNENLIDFETGEVG